MPSTETTMQVTCPPMSYRQLRELLGGRCAGLVPLLDRCHLGLTTASVAPVIGAARDTAVNGRLTRLGLPRFRPLRDCYYLVRLLEEAETLNAALARLALNRGRDPAPYYRFIQRVTGVSWSTARARGTPWIHTLAGELWATAMPAPAPVPVSHDFAAACRLRLPAAGRPGRNRCSGRHARAPRELVSV